MMRSLYSGVSGLKTHQTKMDVIGNNIANVNTTAYKSSSITFSDLMSQTTQSASGASTTTGVGGTNARQIGLGVKSGAITMAISTQGSAQSTGNPFDIMITGDNFFVVSNGSENLFTRDGSFYVDGAGNLAMTSTGYNVMGWQVDDSTGEIKKDTVSALRIMSAENTTYPPEATTKAYVSGIIDKTDTDVTSASGKTINLNFYDQLGYSYTARLTFKQSDTDNVYSVELDGILDSDGNEIDTANALLGTKGQTQTVSTEVGLDGYTYANGQLVSTADSSVTIGLTKAYDLTADADTINEIAKAYGYEGSEDDFLNLVVHTDNTGATKTIKELITTSGLAGNIYESEGTTDTTTGTTTYDLDEDLSKFTAVARQYDGSTLTFDAATGKFVGTGANATGTSITLSLADVGDGNFEDITIDFSNCSNYYNEGTSTVSATSGDEDGIGCGRKLGKMIGVTIDKSGMIYASYDNSMTKLLGQIATASFANASGLEKAGDNLYSATLNSGEFDGIGEDVTASGGYMTTGELEMSNVDLSTEFTEMITTQRGFQANSRIITVSDTLLEELTNLKR